jgi:cell wall assembly regulator SMI1
MAEPTLDEVIAQLDSPNDRNQGLYQARVLIARTQQTSALLLAAVLRRMDRHYDGRMVALFFIYYSLVSQQVDEVFTTLREKLATVQIEDEHESFVDLFKNLFDESDIGRFQREHGIDPTIVEQFQAKKPELIELAFARLEQLSAAPAAAYQNSRASTIATGIYAYVDALYRSDVAANKRRLLLQTLYDTIETRGAGIYIPMRLEHRAILGEQALSKLLPLLDLCVQREAAHNEGETLSTYRMGYTGARYILTELRSYAESADQIAAAIADFQWSEPQAAVFLEIIENAFSISYELEALEKCPVVRALLEVIAARFADNMKVLKMQLHLGHISLDTLPPEERPVDIETVRREADFSELSSVWAATKALCAQHDLGNCTALNAPATAERLERLEGAVGVTLSDDYRALMQLHDGEHNCTLFSDIPSTFPFADFEQFLPIDEALEQHEHWQEIGAMMAQDMGDEDFAEIDPRIKKSGFERGWVPLFSTANGDICCVDLVPSEQGEHGQLIRVSHDEGARRVVSATLSEFFVHYYAALINVTRGWIW